MNLSTDWVPFLEALGHDAVHWSRIDRQDARDAEILAWAGEDDRVILTNDLDFGTLLMASGAEKPSVIQLRTDITLSAHVGPLVARAIERSEASLSAGALVTVEEGRTRVRNLGAAPSKA